MLQSKRLSDDFAESQTSQDHSDRIIAATNEHHTVKSADLQEDIVPKKDSMRNKNEDGGSSSTEKHDHADAIDDEGDEFKEQLEDNDSPPKSSKED